MSSTTSSPQTVPPEEQPQPSLYADKVKVYPKDVKGYYRRLKTAALVVLLAIYYITPWLRWDRGPDAPDQAVLVDIVNRRLYFFFIEIWPQEVYYLTGLLILAAFGLFLATSLFGRIWCGYSCPQTVWTDLYLWIERKIEGDRSKRIRLDNSRWTREKLLRKSAKHTAWLLIALATGGAWVFYFSDAPTLLGDLVTLQAGTGVLFFIGLFTFTTYILAGYAREHVCVYMCPWPRFQSAMLDEDSLVVTYQAWRGEPRGAKRKSESWDNRGDCIDCNQCLLACPTGIDIRDGQQLECIGCGLCIDACNEMMRKVDRPLNLITFDTENNQVARAAGQPPRSRLVRPRTVAYTALVLLVAAIMVGSMAFRTTLDIHVLRDRAPLYVTLSDGDVRNGYTVKFLNMERQDHLYTLSLVGLDEAVITVIGREDEAGRSIDLPLRPDGVDTYRVYVRVPREAVTAASMPVAFILSDVDGTEMARRNTVFLGPE